MIYLFIIAGIFLIILMYSCLAMSSIQDDMGGQELLELKAQEEEKINRKNDEVILKNI